MKRKIYLVIHLFVVVSVFSACGSGAGSSDSAREATLEAISAAVRGTATVEAVGKLNPNAPVETAQAEATVRSQALDATQVAQSALNDEALAATATAFAPFIAELPKYGVDPTKGDRDGFIHRLR